MTCEDVVVTGIGLQSCLGNLKQSWQQLLLNHSGVELVQPFLNLPSYPLGLIAAQPANLAYLTRKLVASAIADAAVELPLRDCGVVIGSSRAAQAQWEELLLSYPQIAAKVNWWNTLPQASSLITAQQIQTEGPVLAPMAACATGIWSIAQGFELIQQGYCKRAIVGAVETPITPLTLVGFTQMNALAKTGCYPFAQHREGLVLAEGGAMLILETATLASRRQASIYGQILGFGLSCDAYHLNIPEPTGKSAIAAIGQCFKQTSLSPWDFDYIHAHGTGTKLNDSREVKIINSIFGDKIAVSSTKGATGHTLGASAALGTAFCLMALKHRQLPPCVGCNPTDFDLNFVTSAKPSKIQKALCFSFGFGGQNAVIALASA
ncbi:beta-ketoacyl-ACP synthase [Gloeocapsa sp. PCC 73106]|uniref:beta-ketoacyl-ACP synthase n=1 Tax=Gloeocapsa sp. PCC 73106 TaxID=102232 RepID=UPI0002AC4B4D|nr:beta-ketoacyl-ACP synthase [Gloeocapsa sp. PCC 73106]ELR99271.1 3-oxoacyl-(acyl-carrier-protein) synthase [Gloeocapsa sp. PCC 73106]